MHIRQVLCVALVALAVVPALGGVLPKVAAAIAVKDLLADKLDDLKVDKAASVPNPSAPTVTAAAEATTVLSVPTVDVSIKKVPVVTVVDAPCKQICANKCKLELQKVCTDVPIVTKECSPTKKAMVKKMCNKKCTLSFETPKLIKGISEGEQPQPNPSTPPTTSAAETQLPSLDKSLKLSKSLKVDVAAFKSDASLAFNANADLAARLGQDDEHANADLALATTATMDEDKVNAIVPTAAASGRRLQGLIAHKAIEAVAAIKLAQSLPVPSCDEVCEDVHFEVPDLECHDETHTVQDCKMVPNQTCNQECVCIPQKTIAVNLPRKPSLTISKDA